MRLQAILVLVEIRVESRFQQGRQFPEWSGHRPGIKCCYSSVEMCGRYTVSKTQEILGTFFRVEFSITHLPIYNASPGQHLPVILDIEPRRIVPAHWGIKPDWAPQESRLLINARAESVNQRPTFRESFRKRRCLVIADGFYEWKATRAGKQPFRITLRNDEPFAFAGIWQEVDGEPAYVILTTEANQATRPIHDRMPVILERREEAPWLDHDVSSADALKLLDPYPGGAMTAYQISKAVNNSRNRDSDLIQPLP